MSTASPLFALVVLDSRRDAGDRPELEGVAGMVFVTNPRLAFSAVVLFFVQYLSTLSVDSLRDHWLITAINLLGHALMVLSTLRPLLQREPLPPRGCCSLLAVDVSPAPLTYAAAREAADRTAATYRAAVDFLAVCKPAESDAAAESATAAYLAACDAADLAAALCPEAQEPPASAGQ